MRTTSSPARKLLLVAALAPAVGACHTGHTAEDAEDLLRKGEPEQALRAAGEAAEREHDPAALDKARRVAFEAALALGDSPRAAHVLTDLRVPPADRDRLLERLAGSTLLAALASPDAGRRAVAASELALAAQHPKLAILVDRALDDPEPAVREVAIGAAAKLDARSAVARLSRLMNDDPSSDVRETAAHALALRLGSVRGDEDEDLAKARALLAARPRPPASATFSLRSPESEVTAALDSPDYEVRLAAVRALGARVHAGDPAGTKRLERLVDDPAEPVRSAAIAALALAKEDAVLGHILATHENPATRRLAFLALDKRAPIPVADLVRHLAQSDPAVAPEAARLLGERGGTAALKPLVASLKASRPEAPAAAHALGALGGPDAVAALVRTLEERDPRLRRAAAEGLARAGGSGVREDLVRAVARPDADADLAAAAALLATFAHPAGGGAAVQESP
jgi:HEAT repeat protein